MAKSRSNVVHRLVKQIGEVTLSRPPGSMPMTGWHRAVCVDVYDQGIVQTQWGLSRLVCFVWELETRDDKGRRMTVSRRFNPTLADNSTLRRFLEVWQGHPFTVEAVTTGINLAEWYVGRDGQVLLEPSPKYRRVVAATPRPAYAEPVVREGFYIRRRWRTPGTEATPEAAETGSEVAPVTVPLA